ncbi:Peptidase inhibitor I78 family protein [Cognatiyoonia koreensis]|uniref:Peptidase inhibitor I78 family protein n=1 Tax=Cognatiyoonia koreensis TaxID=364200 RepID=A0A1I0RFY1_9RHOB|nr:I78 family peptidase inhibitor [Cognatiyoonia koreensis]SEW39165.1 Peptidase inhibitor I78 family protein [Cognatiyoonia koreensis]
MRYLMPIALAGLTACGATGPTAPISSGAPTGPVAGSFPTGLDNTCNGERYGTLVGQDATALERVLILGQVRVIRPGMVVAQDYRPERINFEIGGDNRVTRITCG